MVLIVLIGTAPINGDFFMGQSGECPEISRNGGLHGNSSCKWRFFHGKIMELARQCFLPPRPSCRRSTIAMVHRLVDLGGVSHEVTVVE